MIDTKDGSVVEAASGTDDEWKRIPICIEFLNSQAVYFNKCVSEFCGIIERLREPIRKKEVGREIWAGFEEFVRTVDPDVFHHELSYWANVIGEIIGPF